MDKRTHNVEEDLKHILHIRMSLGHKIDLLEKRVEETVQGTKSVALAALDFARSKAADFIESAVYQLNPTVQAARRPWMMVGGAVAVGLIAGLIEQRRRRAGVYPYYPPQAEGADVMPSPGHEQTDVSRGVYPFYSGQEQLPAPRSFGPSARPRRRTQPSPRSRGWTADVWRPLFSLWEELAGELTQERLRLQGAVLIAGRSFVRDIVRIAGQALLDQLQRPGSMSQRHGQP
ncbi:MAG TPA: hypothetical protein VKB81_05020 [Nitrospira sp.]|nr:hypothetical protein [Nitrospira sp.]